jgi:hypothetical protein
MEAAKKENPQLRTWGKKRPGLMGSGGYLREGKTSGRTTCVVSGWEEERKETGCNAQLCEVTAQRGPGDDWSSCVMESAPWVRG